MKKITAYELEEGWVAIASDGVATAELGPLRPTARSALEALLADIEDDDE